MLKWLCKLLGIDPDRNKPTTFSVQTLAGKTLNFKRIRIWDRNFHYWKWRYFCPACEQRLVGGPDGAGSINLVCKRCHINYGCLPGGDGE